MENSNSKIKIPQWWFELNDFILKSFTQNKKGMTQDKLNSMLQNAGIPISRIPQNLAQQMAEFGIITEGDAKRFLANSLHETGGFKTFSESGFYTTENRLKEVFPSAFGRPGKVGKYNPKEYLRNEVKLFNLVYDDRKFPKGLGNVQDGDGHLFKGRGSQQTTGRNNYAKLSADVGIDFLKKPELLETDQFKFISGLSFWKTNKISNKTNLLDARKAIVGSSGHGYNNVKIWYDKLK